MPKINLGAGKTNYAGYDNYDITYKINNKKYINLEKKLPFNNNSITKILMEHVLEHVFNYSQLLKECYRVLKPNGELIIRVPDVLAIVGLFQAQLIDDEELSSWISGAKEEGYHYHQFTEYRLEYELSEIGFIVDIIDYERDNIPLCDIDIRIKATKQEKGE